MARRIEPVYLPEAHPRYRMPYTPAIRVRGGTLVFVSGVTAAPVYHSHPHMAAEFDGIPEDPAAQTRAAIENLRRALRAAGGDLADIVQLFRFMTHADRTQDAINATMAELLGPHRLATDPPLVIELAAVAVVEEAPPGAAPPGPTA